MIIPSLIMGEPIVQTSFQERRIRFMDNLFTYKLLMINVMIKPHEMAKDTPFMIEKVE